MTRPVGEHRPTPAAAALIPIGVFVVLLCTGQPVGAGQNTSAASEQTASADRLLDVPFVPQTEKLCGGAAAAMVLRYWLDVPSYAEDFASLVDDTTQGIRLSDLARGVRERGWLAFPFGGTAVDVRQHLEDGRPIIALVEERPGRFHYVVVVAWTSGRVVLHDPTRGPFLVRDEEEFDRVWAATSRAALLILPTANDTIQASPETTTLQRETSELTACGKATDHAVRLARGGDLSGAEALLVLVAQWCRGSSAGLRELAGLRFMQQRWDETIGFAERAVERDPSDLHAWQLLAVARFRRGNSDEALRAWNSRNEPRLDLAHVHGLQRTDHEVVIDRLNIRPQSVLTPEQLERARRRIADLPALQFSRVSYSPRANGLATVNIFVTERPLLPRTRPVLVAEGLHAVIAREARVAIASPTRNGELWTGTWRWWSGRPRLEVSMAMPTLANLAGLWRLEAGWERETYAINNAPYHTSRRHTVLSFADWRNGRLRWSVSGGLEHWNMRGNFLLIGGTLEQRLFSDTVAVRFEASLRPSLERGRGFVSTSLASAWRSDQQRQTSWAVAAGWQGVTSHAPLSLWPAADSGHIKPVLLRAHPLLRDGSISGNRLGRLLVHSSGEMRRDLASFPLVRLRWATFVDTALQSRMYTARESSAHIDVGVGLRAEVPGVPDALRIDLARGLRDGNMAVSAAWAPSWPGW